MVCNRFAVETLRWSPEFVILKEISKTTPSKNMSFILDKVACTCNPATLEGKLQNSVGLILVGGNTLTGDYYFHTVT